MNALSEILFVLLINALVVAAFVVLVWVGACVTDCAERYELREHARALWREKRWRWDAFHLRGAFDHPEAKKVTPDDLKREFAGECDRDERVTFTREGGFREE